MTTFNAATDLPPEVNTVERLALWALALLYFKHGKEDYTELQGEQAPLITMQQGMSAQMDERAIFRVSLEVESDWFNRPEKFFLLAREFSAGQVPPTFKTAA